MQDETFSLDYLELLRRGEAVTESHFVRHFTPRMRAVLRRMLRPSEIDDASQEAFLRLFRILRSENSVDDPSKLPAFVHGVNRNVALEIIRKRIPQLPDNGPEPPAKPVDPNAAMWQEHLKRVVIRVLDELRPRDSAILRMHFLEERDSAFICNHFKIKPAHLRLLIHRAKIRFREILGEQP